MCFFASSLFFQKFVASKKAFKPRSVHKRTFDQNEFPAISLFGSVSPAKFHTVQIRVKVHEAFLKRCRRKRSDFFLINILSRFDTDWFFWGFKIKLEYAQFVYTLFGFPSAVSP